MFRKRSVDNNALFTSQLYDQGSFYQKFLHDISGCAETLVIESPFITSRRVATILPVLTKLRSKGVLIVVNTQSPDEHSEEYLLQADAAVRDMQAIGVKVLYTVKHHRKLAIIDNILWEGSLNILSHNDSSEVMRRSVSESMVREMLLFTGVNKYVA